MKTTLLKTITVNYGSQHLLAGTPLIVRYDRDTNAIHCKEINGHDFRLTPNVASKYLSGFTPEPSHTTLRRWIKIGEAKSICGKVVEWDGFDSNEMPSWIIAFNLV